MSLLARLASLLPKWLLDGEGGLVASSIALLWDDAFARVKLGLMARFPEYAPDDAALASLGRDRIIARGPNELAATYAARLVRAFDDHKRRGNPFALLEQIRAFLGDSSKVSTVDQNSNWFAISTTGVQSTAIYRLNWIWNTLPRWWQGWVIIWNPTPIPKSGKLGTRGKLGSTGYAVGVDVPSSIGRQMQTIVRDWKSANVWPRWIILAYDATLFDSSKTFPDASLPDATWEHWGKTVVLGDGRRVRIRARSTLARYANGAV